jgi:hypothetical protein
MSRFDVFMVTWFVTFLLTSAYWIYFLDYSRM